MQRLYAYFLNEQIITLEGVIPQHLLQTAENLNILSSQFLEFLFSFVHVFG